MPCNSIVWTVAWERNEEWKRMSCHMIIRCLYRKLSLKLSEFWAEESKKLNDLLYYFCCYDLENLSELESFLSRVYPWSNVMEVFLDDISLLRYINWSIGSKSYHKDKKDIRAKIKKWELIIWIIYWLWENGKDLECKWFVLVSRECCVSRDSVAKKVDLLISRVDISKCPGLGTMRI